MIYSFFSALAFLTVIPIPEVLKSRTENGMFLGYPAAGFVIGALLSLLYLAAGLLFPSPVAALVLVAAAVALTGGLHLDGLADCADAFCGKRDRESTLRILKDPRIGTMGGSAIALSLLARYAAFSSLPPRTLLLGLPLATTFSRTVVLAAIRVLPYVRSEGGILRHKPARLEGLLALGVVVLLALAVLLPIPVASALVVLALFWRMSWNRIGGCTGDVLGASIELAEIVFLLVLGAMVKQGWSTGLFFALAGLIFPGGAAGA
jgi:adenosylcobinamide-GDP ribazoletransferase